MHCAMVTERLLLLGNLAFTLQPDQNCQSTLALSGKDPSWAALNFQEQSGLPFHSRENGWPDFGPWKTPKAFTLPVTLLPLSGNQKKSQAALERCSASQSCQLQE
jgi:hypothetical protein